MSSAIIARMGIDTAGIAKDMAKGEQALAAGSKRMAGASKNRQAANESLLESEKRVENQMVGLAGKLANSKDASDALADSVGALAESFNLTLGAGILIGAAVELARAFITTRKEAEALAEEIRTLTADQGSPDFRTLGEMETRLTALRKKAEDFGKEISTWDAFKRVMASSQFVGGTGEIEDQGKLHDAVMVALKEEKEAIAHKAALQAFIMAMELDGDERGAAKARLRLEFDEKRGAAIRAQNVPLQQQLNLQQRLAEKQIDQKFDAEEGKALDAHMATLGQIAAQEMKDTDAAKEKKMQAVSAVAEDQAKAAMDLLRDEMRNADALADMDADHAAEKQERETKAADELAASIKKNLADELAARKKAIDEETAHRRQAALDAELSGADGRRTAKREQAIRARAQGKVDRRRAMQDRGGKSAADTKAELYGPTPFEAATAPRNFSRDMKKGLPAAAVPAGKADEDFKRAMDSTQMAKDTATIAAGINRVGKVR